LSEGPKHFHYIDALRGIAFLGVLALHAALRAGHFRFDQWATLGNQGVQLFFIVSALTLFLSFETRSKRENAPVLNFFIRRLFRIAPLFWSAILLYSFVPMRDFDIGFWHYAATALFLHGWHVETMNVVPGGWSIAVEMNFYLLLPMLWYSIRSIQAAFWWLLCSLLVLPLLTWSAMRAFHLENDGSLYLERWLPSQMPVFLLGILLFYTIKKLGTEYRSTSAGRIFFALSIFVIISLRGYYSSRFLPQPVAISCGLWFLALSLHLWPNPLLVNPLMRFIGKVSYSAYITHFIALFIVIDVFSHSFYKMSELGRFLLLIICTLPLTLLFSFVTHRLIELPGERLGSALIGLLERRRSAKTHSLPDNRCC
jgi:peptidoglycan/LPS O-acetylase OafA/YrhL